MTNDCAPALAVENGVATITLRRLKEHNRIDAADPHVILRHLDEVAQLRDVIALVITGSGPRTFCAGYTLAQIESSLDRSFEDMLDAVERCPVPTICALNGSVYGGGTDLAMACDFRIGVHGSRLFMPTAKFGLHYYPGGLRRFVTRLGPCTTKKIFLTARTLDADELLRVGFFTELVEPQDLQAKVNAYVGSLRECEGSVVRSMKEHIDGLAAGTWTEARGRVEYERSLRSESLRTRLAERR
jgi:enoyl-CoA hydratase/carnithine racemase